MFSASRSAVATAGAPPPRLARMTAILLVACLLPPTRASLGVSVEANPGAEGGGAELAYRVFHTGGPRASPPTRLFEGGDLAVFSGGGWCVAPSSSSPASPPGSKGSPRSTGLVLAKQEALGGTLPGLGAYGGTRIEWVCELGGDHRRGSREQRRIATSFVALDSGRAVVFEIDFLDGLDKTSLGDAGEGASLATFPSFVVLPNANANATNATRHAAHLPPDLLEREGPCPLSPSLPSVLSWEGSFVQSVRRLSAGPGGGPTVFYDASDPSLATVVVASPFVPFASGRIRRPSFGKFTAGNHRDWTGSRPAFSPGPSGRLGWIPPGTAHAMILYEGSTGGITATIDEWGAAMRAAASWKASPLPASLPFPLATGDSELSKPGNETARGAIRGGSAHEKLWDVTLEKIGYQTDNGAMYCFCRQSNCSEVLLREKEYLDSIGIPIGYLSFQGAGTSSGRGTAAPWCIERWSADGGQDTNHYPLDTGAFREALGVPLQLYAPYFCPNASEYFSPHTPWKSVASDPGLPGCEGFAFETASAEDAGAFFAWFLAKGIDRAGMGSFESDFMHQNANCVREFVEDPVHGSDAFLAGMAGAALELGTPIQWCYASPGVVLASLSFPSVTNFRVSFDFCYGNSYAIGESSLLVWAAGAAPSKDTLWTTENQRTETPGCAWTEDHEAPAAELHVVLALLSTGPVGISDAIGMTNATLLHRTISADGGLLQPSKPVTAVDSSFREDGAKPKGYLYGTHALGPSWIFVSFRLAEAFPVTARDFWPPLGVGQTARLVHRSFSSSPDCVDGADALETGCVAMVSPEATNGHGSRGGDMPPIFVAPKSSFGSPGSDLSPSVATVWQECPLSGVVFLGELDKYVALSPKRFRSLDCTKDGASAVVRGSEGEVVEITLLVPDHAQSYRVVKRKVPIASDSAVVRFVFRTDHLIQSRITAIATTE